MKKILIAFAIATLALPFAASAATYQESYDYAAGQVSQMTQFNWDNIGSNVIRDALISGKINKLDQLEARISALEASNQSLQQRLSQVQSQPQPQQVASQQSFSTDPQTAANTQNIAALETRVTTLESKVAFILNQVSQVLSAVLNYLNSHGH